jgi:hypothetical protein
MRLKSRLNITLHNTGQVPCLLLAGSARGREFDPFLPAATWYSPPEGRSLGRTPKP